MHDMLTLRRGNAMADPSTGQDAASGAAPQEGLRSLGERARDFASLLTTDDPDRLLPRFRVLSILSGLLIVGLSALIMAWIYRSAMIHDAETTAISVGSAIFANERENLVVRDSQGNEALHVPAERVLEIDRIIRNYLEPFHIHKIKMFAGDKRVIYSTDHGLIGRRDTTNETLDRVLRDRAIDTTAKQKNQVTELGGTVIENRHIVETYLPVISGERVLGAFEVYVDITESSAAINRIVALTALALAAVVTLSMFLLYLPMRRGTTALLDAHSKMDELASTDPLTRVLNRRALIRNAEREMAKLGGEVATRNAGIGLIMLDIDHFKEINDRHGHAAGDHVLQAVARRIEGAVRKGDMIGRYGGEEFLLLLPSSTRLEAIALAERLRAAINATPIDLPDGRQVQLTASFGVNVLDVPEQDFDSAVRNADEALYWAKQAGRNRVRAAQ